MTVALLAHAFVNVDGDFGNPALVIVEPEGSNASAEQRQELATALGIPATVFVRDAARGELSIHSNYGQEIRFGGHPLLGTVEVLHRLGRKAKEFSVPAGRVSCRRDSDGVVWIQAPAAWSKPWRHYEMDSPDLIDALTGLPEGEDFTQVWAWIDREAGRVRARLWAPRIGKGEDEACGSASMILALRLGRALEVVHGRRGAVILARPVNESDVELGGRCRVEEPSVQVMAQIEGLYGDRRG
ncbi:PhzF family phenazine biosynthesis protein [Actinomadura barringtoniae]|uniref:PhzF family phenazine biosynthesis protein n=1 Tax=Actinomadura barringtoniae TaxID=1427535 RepID=A0A939PLT5_9ACTN|nr:PhzF family phenazine biosynthesis protein [Actinomadura barringtoniae]MBO2454438.1 PhzF family phenazine biosynthesis protein [Actinomadura barringtoniae]